MSEEPEVEVEVELDRSRRALWFVAPIGLVVAVLLVVLALSDTQQNQPGSGALGGRVVPAVVGTTLDGETFDIDEQRGRWVVVNFFASWCAPCRRENPELTEFVARHRSGDATLVAIAMSDTRADVQAFVDELGGDWPILVDDTTTNVIDFAVTAPPTTFVVAPSGVVAAEFIGEVTADQLDETIAALSAPAEADQ